MRRRGLRAVPDPAPRSACDAPARRLDCGCGLSLSGFRECPAAQSRRREYAASEIHSAYAVSVQLPTKKDRSLQEVSAAEILFFGICEKPTCALSGGLV